MRAWLWCALALGGCGSSFEAGGPDGSSLADGSGEASSTDSAAAADVDGGDELAAEASDPPDVYVSTPDAAAVDACSSMPDPPAQCGCQAAPACVPSVERCTWQVGPVYCPGNGLPECVLVPSDGGC